MPPVHYTPHFTQAVLDDFNRADENPLTKGGAWSSGIAFPNAPTPNPMRLVSNRMQTSVSGSGGGQWWTTPFDGEVYVTNFTDFAPFDIRLFMRIQNPGTSTSKGYMLRWNFFSINHVTQLSRVEGGGSTEPLSSGQQTLGNLAPGDRIGLRVWDPNVSTVRLEVWRSAAGGGTWTLLYTLDDTTAGRLAAGYVGLGGGTAIADDFGGGALDPGFDVLGRPSSLTGRAEKPLPGPVYPYARRARLLAERAFVANPQVSPGSVQGGGGGQITIL